jgi:hypothetical protein
MTKASIVGRTTGLNSGPSFDKCFILLNGKFRGGPPSIFLSHREIFNQYGYSILQARTGWKEQNIA